jgi:hypothetical protein
LNCLRLGIRFPVEFPVKVQWETRPGKVRQIKGEIVTMSSNGLFMRLPSRLRPNTRITLTASLPTAITRIPLELCCRARVVGQRDTTTYPFGVGAIIDDYQFRTASEPA